MKTARRDAFLITTLLLAILVLAAAVRFYNLGAQSLWSDEGNSAALATRTLAQIARDAGHDIHPPLYYWLLHLWANVFGTTEIALRSLSALLGVLLVLVVAEVSRQMYGATAGLIAALVAALAPFQVYYSQEARMYILVAVLATAAFLYFWRLIQSEERRLPGSDALRGDSERWSWLPLGAIPLLIVWIAGLYTHYSFPLVIGLITGLYAIWVWLTRKQGWAIKRLARWALYLLLTLLCFAPWLPIALQQAMSWPTGGVQVNPLVALQTSLALLALGPVGKADPGAWQVWVLVALAALGALPWRFLISPFVLRARGQQSQAEPADGNGSLAVVEPAPPSVMMAVPVMAGAVSVGGTAAAVPVAEASSADLTVGLDWPEDDGSAEAQGTFQGRARYWLRWLTPLAWLAGPLAMMLALGLFRDAYLKFLLIASPAFCLLIARGLAGPANALGLWGRANLRTTRPGLFAVHDLIGSSWMVLGILLVSGISASALSTYYTDARFSRDDYKGIVQFIGATAEPGDAVVLDAPGQAEVFNYYYRGNLPVYPLPGRRPLDKKATLADLEKLRSHNKLYVLYWASQEADPDGMIEGWLDKSGYKTLDQWHGNVRLAVYVMPEIQPPDETVDNLDAVLGNQIGLRGYRAWNLTPQPGEVTQLQLLWEAKQKPDRRYKVFLQLLDPRDQVIAQRDAEPAGESQPTTSWEPGKVIEDNHGLLIPPGTPPGSYRRIVGMYDAETMERLRLSTGEDHIDLPPINVERAAGPPAFAALGMQQPLSYDVGGIKLLGYDHYKRGFKHAPETAINPGDLLHLTFYWQANVRPRADWWFDLTLADSGGRVVADLQAPLVGPNYSTTLWEAQEVVRGEHDLSLPADLAPGTYRLSLTLLPDTNTPAGVSYLGEVKVEKP